ncbi:MAG: hypothetical protein GF313_07515 [Caldithrix sp.]|nr:hypothetical protein [Caldithrix sp.]
MGDVLYNKIRYRNVATDTKGYQRAIELKPTFHTGVGLGRFAGDFGCIEDFFLFTIAKEMMIDGEF